MPYYEALKYYMIIAQITNGLGNQMFQYATARRLSLQRRIPLNLDISFYEKVMPGIEPRNFDLRHLNIKSVFASDEDIARYCKPDSWSTVWRIRRRLGLSGKIFAEKKWGVYDPAILTTSRNVYLVGYWQNEGYFKDIREVLLKEFQPQMPMDAYNQQMAEKIRSVTSVCIHIRRGDYVSDPVTLERHGVLPLTYYDTAVRLLTEEVPNPYFFIFSDEPEWAKAHLKLQHPAIIIDKNSAESSFKDLWLMSCCKHHIIANSTFSWWGAWLSQHPQQIVYAPKQWFTGSGSYAEPVNIVPVRWRQI